MTKDADATMATMVQEPYVNHIPTMTGGIGAKDLHRFYRDFFIPGNPPSMKVSGIFSEPHLKFVLRNLRRIKFGP